MESETRIRAGREQDSPIREEVLVNQLIRGFLIGDNMYKRQSKLTCLGFKSSPRNIMGFMELEVANKNNQYPSLPSILLCIVAGNNDSEQCGKTYDGW